MPNLPRLTPFRALGFALMILVTFAGCCKHAAVAPIQSYSSPALLFDRDPTAYLPDTFAFRFDDRRVVSSVRLDKQVSYRKYLYDVQGGWNLNRDYYTRRFRSVIRGHGGR